MSDTATFTRTVNIYVDSGQAQAAYDALAAKQAGLNTKLDELRQKYSDALDKAAVEGTKKAQDAAKRLGDQLTDTKDKIAANEVALDRLAKKASGELSASLKDLQATSSKLNQELNKMSKEDAGFGEKKKQADEAKKALEEYLGTLGRTKAAAHEDHGEGFGGVAMEVAAGFGLATTAEALLEKGVDTLKEAVEEAMKAEEIQARLQNSLEGVGRKDLLPEMKKQAEELGEEFRTQLPSDIMDTQSALVTFGHLSKNQIDELLPVILNYAAKTRKDLPAATEDILRALEGQGKGLKALGVEIIKGGGVTENFNIIMTQLKSRVEGAEAALEGTHKGGWLSFKTWLKEVSEESGGKLLDLFSTIKEGMNGGAAAAEAFNQAEATAKRLKAEKEKTDGGENNNTALAGERENILERYRDELKIAEAGGKDVFEAKKKLLEEELLLETLSDTQRKVKEAELTKLIEDELKKRKDAQEEYQKFLFKVGELKKEVEAKGQSTDAAELQKLQQKYDELERENDKFYSKGLASLAKYNATAKQLKTLFAEESEKLEDKQYGSKMEKDLAASQSALTRYYDEQKAKVKEQFALQLIGKDDYDKQVESLDSQQKHALEVNFLSYYDALKDAYKDDKAKLAKLEDDKVKNNLAAYNQDIDNYIKAQARKNADTNAKDAADVTTTGMGFDPVAKRDARLKQLADELEQKLKLVQGNEAAITQALADAAAKRQNIEKEFYSEIGSDIKKYGDDAVNIFTGIEKIVSNVENAQLAKDKQANKQKEDNLKDQLDKKQISQKQYNDGIAAINKKQLDEENRISKEQFAIQKGLKLAQAVISIAAAETNALALPPPMNFIEAAIIGAAGAVQIGVIASEQFTPKYERGTDSILNGPAHSGGGIKMVNSDTGKITGELEGDEAVISKATTRANMPIIQALLRANGRQVLNSTRAIENNRYATGGFIGQSTSGNTTIQPVVQNTTDNTELLEHIKGLRQDFRTASNKQVVFVKDNYDYFANQQGVVFQKGL